MAEETGPFDFPTALLTLIYLASNIVKVYTRATSSQWITMSGSKNKKERGRGRKRERERGRPRRKRRSKRTKGPTQASEVLSLFHGPGS